MRSDLDDTMELPLIKDIKMPSSYSDFLKLDDYSNDPEDVAPVKDLYKSEE